MPDHAAPRAGWIRVPDRALRWTIAAVLLPLVLFLILRPETYGPSVNRLDGWFYTGYAANFDDILPAISDHHYFVSRWTLYLPSYLFSEVFGPEFGRLLLRWIVASCMLLALWSLGRRWKWGAATELVVGTVVISTPMFARAFFTDYFEWVTASVGLILVCLSLSRPRWARTITIAVLAALIVGTNPTAGTVVAGPVLIYLLRLLRGRWQRALLHGAAMALTGGAVLAMGLLVFRWHYGIDNIYAPTVDFIRSNTDYVEPLRSPTLTWMAAYVWIYTPIVLLVFAALIRPARELLRRDWVVVAAFVLMMVQYAYQFADQFVRQFVGLEIEYYWAFVYPTFLVAAAITLGAVRWTWAWAVGFIGVWLGTLILLSAWDLNIPGRIFLLVAVIAAVALAALPRLPRASSSARLPIVALTLLQVGLVATQLAPPAYTPPASHRFDLRPYFEEVYLNPNSPDVQRFRDALWLVDLLDHTRRDRQLFFVIGQSDFMGALYGAHVTGHMIYPDAEGHPPPDAVAFLTSTKAAILLYGDAEQLATTVAQFEEAGLEGRITWKSPVSPRTGAMAWRFAVRPR